MCRIWIYRWRRWRWWRWWWRYIESKANISKRVRLEEPNHVRFKSTWGVRSMTGSLKSGRSEGKLESLGRNVKFCSPAKYEPLIGRNENWALIDRRRKLGRVQMKVKPRSRLEMVSVQIAKLSSAITSTIDVHRVLPERGCVTPSRTRRDAIMLRDRPCFRAESIFSEMVISIYSPKDIKWALEHNCWMMERVWSFAYRIYPKPHIFDEI